MTPCAGKGCKTELAPSWLYGAGAGCQTQGAGEEIDASKVERDIWFSLLLVQQKFLSGYEVLCLVVQSPLAYVSAVGFCGRVPVITVH